MKPGYRSLFRWIPFIGMLLAAAALLYPVLHQDASFCIKYDNLQQAYPWMNKLASSLHKGYWPVWDANTYGGRSFAGEMQTGIFYPLNIVWCLLFGSVNGIDVYYLDWLVVLHYVIALLGMYRVAKAFRLSSAAAVTSALVYTFTGALAGRSGAETCIFFGLSLLPWVVFLVVTYYNRNKNKLYLILAGIIAGLQILAGHMQPFFHTLIILTIYIAFTEYKCRQHSVKFILPILGSILIVFFIAILIALPQLYYSLQYLSSCYRWVNGGVIIGPGQKVPLSIYAYWFIVQASDLSNLFQQAYIWDKDSNTIYMGLLPLALIILYFWRFKSLQVTTGHLDLTLWLLIVCIIGVVSALGYQTFFHLILYQIPFMTVLSRQLGRYIILISFSASLLAGLGLHYMAEIKQFVFSRHSKIIYYTLVLLIINELYLVLFQQAFVALQTSVPLLLCFVFLLLLMENIDFRYLSGISVLIVFIDLSFNPVNYVSAKDPFYPSAFYRRDRIIDLLEKDYGRYRVTFDMKNDKQEPKNIGDVYSIQTDFGFGATANMAYFDFYRSPGATASAIDDLLNVKYVLADRTLDSTYRLIDSTRRWKFYERSNYYPRTYWKSQLGKPGKEIEKENKGKIDELAYSDLYQKYAVECEAADSLVFSENTYPGWTCKDNGREIQVSKATIGNYPRIFRCIALAPGHHVIEFKYKKVFHWF